MMRLTLEFFIVPARRTKYIQIVALKVIRLEIFKLLELHSVIGFFQSVLNMFCNQKSGARIGGIDKKNVHVFHYILKKEC